MIEQPGATIERRVEALMRGAVDAYLEAGGLERPADADMPEVRLEQPRNPDHGDWACNVAMQLARALRRKPREIAEGIVAHVPAGSLIEPPEVAGPGFINLRLGTGAMRSLIEAVLARADDYARSDIFRGQSVLVEFVSANPTGPLHIGHCRGAVLGDVLARIFEAVGYRVGREYYYNDAGVQMRVLGESVRARYLQALGREAAFPENGYHGEYITELGQRLKAERGADLADETDTQPFTDFATAHILKLIEADLEALRIRFDTWFSETTLHNEGEVARALDVLKQRGRTYEHEGAVWLRTADMGDEKDRVVVKSDGNYTYLAPDIAYHAHKFGRGYDRLVNTFGADHHGYVPRLKAAVASLGYRADQLDVVILQMVSVQRSGEVQKLSTRAGEFITLKEVIDEIGPDVTRFMFLMRAADSQMVFDFDLARDTSMDNPYYYVQYAHARCCSLMARAEQAGQPWLGSDEADLTWLTAPEEKAIVRQMDRLPGLVLECAATCEPMPLTAYLRDLATAFHAYYTAGNKDTGLRVIQEHDSPLTQARLTLIAALRQTLANGLRLLGVEPLERL